MNQPKLTGAQKSRLHELKQAWKSARARWLKLVRVGDEEQQARSDAAWATYEQARDAYFGARKEYGL